MVRTIEAKTNKQPEAKKNTPFYRRVAEGEKELKEILGQSDEELAKIARKTDLSVITGSLGPDELSKRANELLQLDESKIIIPEEIYAEAKTFLGIGGHARHVTRENCLKRRRFILETIRDKKKPYLSSDGDGTCTFKTVQKVENTRSTGSTPDKHFLRNLIKGFVKLGAVFEINTARTGPIPGPSAVGAESPKFKDEHGNWQNPRSPNEISSILHEFGIHSLDNPESKKLFDSLIINGLSGGLIHDPKGKLTISPATIRYGNFIEILNQIALPGAEHGFLSKLEEIVDNKKEHKPLKVLEYKSIPKILIDYPDFSLEKYIRYIDLVEKSRESKISDAEFFNRLNNSDIKLPKEYYDPTNPPISENELTRKIRKGSLACLTPHAFDSDNRIREDLKIKIYEYLTKFCRSKEAQEWAEQTYGIPKGTSLFTINNKDVSEIDFSEEAFKKRFQNLNNFRKFLKSDEGKNPANPEHILINVIENPQPYCEIAPNTSKADVLPSKEKVDAENLMVIAAGDSPSSDAPMLAQAIILGGAGFIVRGLMTETDVATAMIDLLAKKSNQWHNNAMTEIKNEKNESVFKLNRTGEIRSRTEWAKEFLADVEAKIYKCSNIHENNAFNAAILAEFFSDDPELSLKLDENKAWVKEVYKATNQRSLVTPLNESNEKALEGQVYTKPLLEKYPFLNNIPFISNYLKIEKAGDFFNTLLGGVSSAMMIATPFEILGETLGIKTLSGLSRLIQKWSYRFNTVASGVSRGLVLSAHQFPWQFLGECFGFCSTFFKDESKFGKILRALTNTMFMGRANELAMRSNYNLDDFSKNKSTQDLIKEQYEHAPIFKEKRLYFDQATKTRMDRVDYLEHNFLGGLIGKIPFVGRLTACAIADSMQALRLSYEFVRYKALNKFSLPNFFTLEQVGPTKVSKNSGKRYGEVHEEHVYAFSGVSTLAVSLLSIGAMAMKNKFFSSVLTSLANMIPSLGVVTAGKLVYQDQAGDPRLFTDITKKQQQYSPEQSGLMQMFGGWGQFLSGMFINTSWGPAIYDFFTGLYLRGIREQLKGGIDDAAVNQKTLQGRYYINNDRPAAQKSLATAV